MAFVQIGDYPCDVFEKEVHKFANEVSNYAVEVGSDVTDNVRSLPDALTIEAAVSDTPFGAIAQDPTRVGVGDLSISQDAFNRLKKMRNDKLPLSVVTSLGTYTSMEIQSFEVTREPKSFKGLVFTIQFQKVVIVENKRVTVANPNLAGKGSVGNLDSSVYRRVSLFPGQTIPVVTLTDRKAVPAWTKIYGKPIATAAEVVLVDGITPKTIEPDGSGFHFDITGSATNNHDGYIKFGGDVSHRSDVTYEALSPRSVKSTNQVVQDLISQQQTTRATQDFANSHGQHYDPQSGQWKDASGNPVTRSPNGSSDAFKQRVRDTPDHTLTGNQ